MSDDDEGRVALEIGVPADASGYLRHECPACMLEFKIKGDESRFTDVLAAWVSKAALANGVQGSDRGTSKPTAELMCPYCSERNVAQEFLHREWQALMKHVAIREIVEPLVQGMFSEMEKSFSGLKSGLVSIRIESNSTRSPRPLSGPDPNDMVRVACVACDERFKLVEGWRGTVHCPSCFSELRLG